MRQLTAFIKKEFLGQYRSGRLFILGAVFLFFGIMSPAIAKLTPKLIELVSQQDQGIRIETVKEVTAIDSFDQFFKNISTAMIVFVIMQAGIFTKEYSSGTLLLSLTRGMERRRVIAAKALTLITVWTVCFWLCFGVAYGYTAYFWDMSVVQQLWQAVLIWWLYGIWYIVIIVFFSTFINSSVGVIACAGGIYLSGGLLGMIPNAARFLPSQFSEVTKLIRGENIEFIPALTVITVTGVMMATASVPIFNRKQI